MLKHPCFNLLNVLMLSPEHVLLNKSFLFIYILVKYIKQFRIYSILNYILINIYIYHYYRALACDIRAHCTNEEVD